MDKLDYLAKTLSRTKRKDYENFVINTIWNRLDRDDIQPVSQQYVRNHEGGRRFIDLYFPQLNIGIECNEAYHQHQLEKDQEREAELIDVLNAINQEDYVAFPVDVYKGYEHAMRQIDVAVHALREKSEELCRAGKLDAWNPELTAAEYFEEREEITTSDNIGFKTIADACNVLFSSGYEGMQMAYFVPRGPFRNRFSGRYRAWFPKISVDGSNASGWLNLIEPDGSRLYESNVDGRDFPADEPEKRLIIPYVFDPVLRTSEYRFIGVFEMDGFTEKDGRRYRVWSRVDDAFPILKDMPSARPSRKMLASINKCINIFENAEENYENEHKAHEALLALSEQSEWKMDCGHAFGQLTFDGDSSNEYLQSVLSNVNDIGLLGSGVYSQWRYITHWTEFEMLLDQDNREYFLLILRRLKSLVEASIQK